MLPTHHDFYLTVGYRSDHMCISLPTSSACQPFPSLPGWLLSNSLLAHHMGFCIVQSVHDKASLRSYVYRASQQGFSQWEQAQPHLISLFRQQPPARQAASRHLATQLGLTEALRQLPDKAGNAQVAQDPFAKLLDGGVTAQVTAACASRISSSFRSVLAAESGSHQWYPCLWLCNSTIAGFQ